MAARRNTAANSGRTLVLAIAAALAAAAPAYRGLLAADPPAWSPSREAAVIVDSLPAAHATEILPDERVLTGSRMLRRPAGLSRPAPAPFYGPPAGRIVAGEPLPLTMGTPIADEMLPGEMFPGGVFAGEVLPGVGGDCGLGFCEPCVACPPDCCGTWQSCGPIHPLCLLPRPRLEGLEFFGGVQGFTGPANRGGSGSFGFHEGFNWGMPVCGLVAWQWGVTATQSTFDGNYLTSDDRNQLFLTGGFFRRVDWGLQWGLVVDYLHDEWDYEADLMQLRGELSWLFGCRHEIGFWFTAGVHQANNIQLRQAEFDEGGIEFDTQRVTFEANDLFAFFYRRQLACGGEGRLFTGFTSNSQCLLGADILLPITPCWSLRSGFLYVVPDNSGASGIPGFVEETWNVGISLVWTPCARPALGPKHYCRPLLTVADNGAFPTRIVRE